METRIKNLIMVAILSLALAIPPEAMPQRHGDANRNRTERPQQRPNNRPDPKPQPQPQRPGNGPAQRPGNRPDPKPQPQPQRPGNGPAQRPGNSPTNRPVPRPQPQRPNNRPAPPHNWSRPMPPPPQRHRIVRPIPPRPAVPPPGYRPYVHAPALHSILGITFGTIYNTALSYLFNNGYSIDGYANNTIYLSNVLLLNEMWPYATLYCNSAGQLSGAQFSYYSSSYGLGRYNSIYNMLCRNYGTPLSLSTGNNLRQVMWYAGGNTGYITLEFSLVGGSYYTTLSVGT